jgi:hypothetical protein
LSIAERCKGEIGAGKNNANFSGCLRKIAVFAMNSFDYAQVSCFSASQRTADISELLSTASAVTAIPVRFPLWRMG